MIRKLNRLYEKYNRREFVHPDPVEFLYSYHRREDREIAGLIASCLAYGRVWQILKSVSSVLDKMGSSPHAFLAQTPEHKIRLEFKGFVHRFAKGPHLSALLISLKRNIKESGSLYHCFLDGFSQNDVNVLPALIQFTNRIEDLCGNGSPGHLVPCPQKNSACKRLNLFLRWMVRTDAVDPGGWDAVPKSKLLVPLDIHMYRFSREMNLTSRNQANMHTVLEITEAFKRWAPDDPVRFDFALTRFGIRDDLSLKDIWET